MSIPASPSLPDSADASVAGERPPGNAEDAAALVRQRLIAGSSSNLAVQIISKLHMLAFAAVGARILTQHDLGALLAMQAAALIAVTVWDFGSTSLIIRQVAAGVISPHDAVRAAMRLRARLLVPAVLVGAVLLPAARGDLSLATLGLIALGAACGGLSTVYNGVLCGETRFSLAAMTQLSGRVVALGLLGSIATWGSGAHPALVLAGVYVLTEATTLLAQWRACARHAARAEEAIGGDPHFTISGATPYAINSMLNLAYNRADVLIVAVVASETVAGAYAPASQIQNVLVAVPALVSAGLLPAVAAAAGRSDFLVTARRALRVTVLLGLLAAVPILLTLSLYVHPLLDIAIGRELAQVSATPVLILMWVLPVVAIETPLSQVLIAGGLASTTTRAFVAGFGVSLLAHCILDPMFGATGAAVASLLRDPVTLLLLLPASLRMLRGESTHRSRA